MALLVKENLPTCELRMDNAIEEASHPVLCIKGILIGKKRQVYKFYRQQSNLLENFQNDSKQIQAFF